MLGDFFFIGIILMLVQSLMVAFIINCLNEDNEREAWIWLVLCICSTMFAIFTNYSIAKKYQEATIKECYYNQVEVKVTNKYKTDNKGTLLELGRDSVFYIVK